MSDPVGGQFCSFTQASWDLLGDGGCRMIRRLKLKGQNESL